MANESKTTPTFSGKLIYADNANWQDKYKDLRSQVVGILVKLGYGKFPFEQGLKTLAAECDRIKDEI